jgi:hypothetical protein
MNSTFELETIIDGNNLKMEAIDNIMVKKSSKTVQYSYNNYQTLKNDSQFENLNSFMQEINTLNKKLVKRKFDNYSIPYSENDKVDFALYEEENMRKNTNLNSRSNYENFFNINNPIRKLSNENILRRNFLIQQNSNKKLTNSDKKCHSTSNSDSEDITNDENSNLELNEKIEFNGDSNNIDVVSTISYGRKDQNLYDNSQIYSKKYKKNLVRTLFKDDDHNITKRIETGTLYKL